MNKYSKTMGVLSIFGALIALSACSNKKSSSEEKKPLPTYSQLADKMKKYSDENGYNSISVSATIKQGKETKKSLFETTAKPVAFHMEGPEGDDDFELWYTPDHTYYMKSEGMSFKTKDTKNGSLAKAAKQSKLFSNGLNHSASYYYEQKTRSLPWKVSESGNNYVLSYHLDKPKKAAIDHLADDYFLDISDDLKNAKDIDVTLLVNKKNFAIKSVTDKFTVKEKGKTYKVTGKTEWNKIKKIKVPKYIRVASMDMDKWSKTPKWDFDD